MRRSFGFSSRAARTGRESLLRGQCPRPNLALHLTRPATAVLGVRSSPTRSGQACRVVRRRRKWLHQPMNDALRLSSLALFAVGPVVAVLALLRRGLKPSPTLFWIRGWRWYVPVVLLPVEWLFAPALIALRVGG